MKRLTSLFLVGILAATVASVWSQSVEGTIVGTVRDPSNALVPSVALTVKNTATGIARSSTANEGGAYVVPYLQPGTYEVSAEAKGFRRAVVKGVLLEVNQTVRVDIALQVGAVTESLTVEANASQVETETSALGQVVHSRQIVEMPLNGRNFIQLGLLSSGVSAVPEGGFSSIANSTTNRTNASLIINGNRESRNSWLLDGVETRNPFLNIPNLEPSVDAIQEFKIQKNSYAAEFGNGSGIVNIAIKSGSNQWHGSAYEFFRNNKLDARGFFDGRSVPPLRQNQWGATVGGPIVKDRTFIFGAYESLREHRTVTINSLFPNPSLFNGDLSSISGPIFNPFTGSLVLCGSSPSSCPVPFANNKIPDSLLNKVALAVTKFWPKPNVTGNPAVNQVSTPLSVNDFDQFNLRADHRFSDQDQAFVRYSFSDSSNNNPGAAPYFGQIFPQRPQNLAANYTHIFNPSLVNEFRFGFNRNVFFSIFEPAPTNIGNDVGLRHLENAPPQAWGIPTMNIAGFFTGPLGGIGPLTPNSQFNEANSYQFVDQISLVRGKHTFKTGADITRIHNLIGNGIIVNGSFSFVGIYSGSPLADYLMGVPLVAVGSTGVPLSHLSNTQWSFFAQDDYRVTSRLTLNYGVRYEYISHAVEDGDNLGSAFNGQIYYVKDVSDQIPASLRPVAHFGLPRGLVPPDRNDVLPRFGFAYKPFNSDKTVIRGGFGIFLAGLGGGAFTAQVPPFSTFLFQIANVITPSATLNQLLPDAAAGNTLLVFGEDPSDRDSYTEQWNFTFQHQLLKDAVFEAAYVGQEGHKLSKRFNANQAPPGVTPLASRVPFPLFGEIVEVHNEANSSYQALQTRFDKRFSKGLTLLAAYTYSKSIDADSGVLEAASTESRFNRNLDRGPSDFDVPHKFTLSYVYDLPFGPGRAMGGQLKGAGAKLAGGWQVSGITTLASGTPFYVTTATSTGTTTVFGTNRADRVCDGNLPSDQRTALRWFDTTCFKDHPANAFGNAGRNILRQDGRNVFDFSVAKNTALTERTTLQFRSEFFNIFNHTNFARPGNIVTTPATFGVVTQNLRSGGRSREIQFGLKLIF